jgi:hypothetical protein
MPKLNQQGKKQYETPQVTSEQLATKTYGDMAPNMEDVIKSANSRGQSRHEMKKTEVADVDVLPESAQMVRNEMVGVKDNGYLAKKGLMFGVNAFYNSLPPGMDIEDQELSDIREMKMVAYEGGLSFPGDGWTMRTEGEQMPDTLDMGRRDMTNYKGSQKI